MFLLSILYIYIYNMINDLNNYFWIAMMIQEGTTFDHDFYVVVGKQCRTENAYAGHQHNIFI